MIQDKTKINRRNQGQETIIKEEVIGIFFFNIIILVAPKGAVLLVVLKNQCGPSRHLPGFSTIS